VRSIKILQIEDMTPKALVDGINPRKKEMRRA
jgi:hypothetical protein